MKRLLLIIPVFFTCYILGLLLSYFVTYNFTGVFDIVELSKNSYTMFPIIVGGGSYLIYAVGKLTEAKKENAKLGSKTKEGKEISQYFDSRWITEKELRKEPKFHFCNWSSLGNMEDGTLLRSEFRDGKLLINMYRPMHSLILGTTGTGKTKKYIEPIIQIMSSTKTKPSFVISDPKGELYKTQNHKLLAEGYDVKVFDLRHPFASDRWNPLDNSFTLYQRAYHLKDEVITHIGVNPADLDLHIIAKEYNNEWYEFHGVAYPNEEMLEQDLLAQKAQLIDMAESELREISTILCPIQPNVTDQSWDRGAQEFIFGTMLAMLEDSLNPTLNMTREKFNFYNLRKICNYKDSDASDPYKTLRAYFTGRDKFSKVLGLVSTAVNNAPSTTKSYMGIVGGHLGVFNDSGMCFATSLNEMNFDNFGDKPTALFIIIPDEKVSRHGIATMMISQLYSKLVELADKYPKGRLPRTVYFLLDEFANLPKIEKMDTMITVSRSRNIFFTLVVQSLSQLSAKYGEEVSKTILGNCPVKLFIGTDDSKTCEQFSKICGDITLQATSISKSTQNAKETDKKKDVNSSNTSSTSIVSRPLIYPDELGHLKGDRNASEIVVKILNEYPMRMMTTASFATPMFDHTNTEEEYAPSRSLNESEVTFNITERNRKVLHGADTSNSKF